MERHLVRCSLMLVFDGATDRLFLAKKARGFGEGKWLGFGGKMEPGETMEQTALREMAEETGATLTAPDVRKLGLLLFTFHVRPNYYLEVHVFKTRALSAARVAQLTLSDEFESPGRFFERAHLPVHHMWTDFRLWVDKVYADSRFRARVHYADFDRVDSYALADVTDAADTLEAREGWK